MNTTVKKRKSSAPSTKASKTGRRRVRETEVGGRRAVVPRVSGSAYITAFSNFVLDEDDPLPNGFRL